MCQPLSTKPKQVSKISKIEPPAAVAFEGDCPRVTNIDFLDPNVIESTLLEWFLEHLAKRYHNMRFIQTE